MMKKLAFILTLIPFLAGAFPVSTNLLDFDPSESTGAFDDYIWRWSGFDDQSVELLFKDVTVSNVGFRMAYPQRGRVFLDILPPATTNSFIVITNEVLDVYTNFYSAIFNRVTDRGFTNLTETLNYSNGIFLSRSVVTNSSKVGSVQNTTQVLPPATVVITQRATVTNTEPYGLFTNSFVQSANITITITNNIDVASWGFGGGRSVGGVIVYPQEPPSGNFFVGALTNVFTNTFTFRINITNSFSIVSGRYYQFVADWTSTNVNNLLAEFTPMNYRTYLGAGARPFLATVTTNFVGYLQVSGGSNATLNVSYFGLQNWSTTNYAKFVSTNTVTLPATNVVEFAFPSTQRVSKIYSKTETPYSRTTFSIPRLSIPPDGPYFSEVLTYSGSSPTNATQSRTLAKGQVTVENSIWGVTNYAGFTNYPGPWEYLLQDGSRAMAGNLNMGGFGVTNASVFSFSSGPSITASNVNLWNSFIVGTNVGLVTGTEFGGDVTGTYDNIRLKKDALVDMDFVDFDTTFNTAAEGRLVATDNGGLQYGLSGGAHSMYLGHEVLAYARNGETNTLTRGTVVYFEGNIGDVPLVKRASATIEIQCRNLAGIVTEPIPVNGFGRVTWYGQVRDLTINPHTVYTNSTILYLSTVPGQFTNVPPKAPNHRVVLGRVERNQSSGGGDIIHVQIDIGEHLEYLHDVNVDSATTDDLLIYNGTLWTNYARTNLNSIYLPLAGGTVVGDLRVSRSTTASTALVLTNSGSISTGLRVDLPSSSTFLDLNSSADEYTFTDSQANFHGNTIINAVVDGYLTTTGAAATYVNTTNLPAGIVTTNNLSTIAGSGLGVTSNRLVVTNAPSISALTNYLPLAGGTMEGSIDMSGSQIENVGNILFGGTNYISSERFFGQWAFDGLVIFGVQPQIPGYVTTNGNAAGLTNFPSSILTVTAGNANYWRITTAPTGSTSSGSSGQMAVSGTNLFIYSPNALGVGTARWLRVNAEANW